MSINPRFVFGDLDLTDAPFMVEFGSDFGNPESVTDILSSLLADGEIESLSRRSNRTLSIPVLIDDSDFAALALAEKALIVECDRQRNTLTIDPGDGIGPATVFDTFAASPARVYDDDTETAGYRRWVITIKALPYARSTTKIVDNAGTPPSSGTVVYNCESTTGWASTHGGTYPATYTVDSTVHTEGTASIRSRSQYVNTGAAGGNGTSSSFDSVSGLSISTGTGGYLSVAVRGQFALTMSKMFLTTTTGGRQEVASFFATQMDAAGFVHFVTPVASGLTITAVEMWTGQSSAALNSATVYTWFDDFEILSSATADHQIVKQLDVQGSARTVGSLHVAAPSDVVALGRVLAITAPTDELPAGFTPDGRRWMTQGTTTADVASPDGSYLTPDTATYSSASGKPIFDVPVTLLTPGPYAMVALVKVETSPTVVGVQAQLRIGSTDVAPTSTAEVSLPGLATGYQFVTVGTCYLPPLPMQSADSTAKVRLLFKGAKLSNVYFIPAWQVGGRPVADFSIIDCGTATPAAGGSSSNLWIDSPSTDQPQGGWWRGPTADRANAQSAWPDAKKPGVHAFKPGNLTAFLVSTNAQGPQLALEYYPAWLGSAAL